MKRPARALLAALLLALCLVAAAVPATAASPPPVKRPVATGTGGAIATVDLDASAAGLEVLRHGGNAVDAAVAAAATLGVTEAYSAGIGGGGFMVVYLAGKRRVVTIDGRETAPAAFGEDSFIDPATGAPIPSAERITSGLGVGVPGTLATWQRALRDHGTRPLGKLLEPAIRVAERGFVVDQTFHDQTASNAARFAAFPATAELFLPGGAPPAVGSVLRNPDLADTYELLARHGTGQFYRGRIAEAIADTVQDPPVDPASTLNVRPGVMTEDDLAAYRALERPPTRVGYRGHQVYGMGPPSSGGSTVGEALNILEGYDLGAESRTQALFHYLEASRLAFADRNRWVGDPGYVGVPLRGLLSQGFADERRCLIGERANLSPVPPGDPFPPFGPGCPAGGVAVASPAERPATTHLSVADRWGNVVSYTLTIEQTGGSGIVVPGHGFLLNNELTDFNYDTPGHPNEADGDKRPRISISPTIVTRDGRPVLAIGSPGGATIITTVLQVLVEHLDRGASLPEAIAAPRVSQRNTSASDAEPAFLASPEAGALEELGEVFQPAPATAPLPSEIGAAAGVALGRQGLLQAAAEPVRRGGGSALVVHPRP